MPETKQRTLEELDYVFGVPTKRFINYQVTKALPWWIQRWVFFNKNAKLESLYQFDHGIDGAHQSVDTSATETPVREKTSVEATEDMAPKSSEKVQ